MHDSNGCQLTLTKHFSSESDHHFSIKHCITLIDYDTNLSFPNIY